jgi:Mrp family chromosome partitioning ATPase
MSTIIPLDAEKSPVPEREQTRVTPILKGTPGEFLSGGASVRGDQIQALVEQLFFRPAAGPVRFVGFSGSDASTGTAQLCLEVARVLAEEGKYDVGLIDASPGAVPLQTQLNIAPTPRPETSWPIVPRLWLVPRQSWLPAGDGQRIPEVSFSRLRELTTEFDFAVLCCPSVSWVTARIAHACDGLVLVLRANKTRRMVAAQMKDLLRHAQVPLLGTVLAERRLPIPEGLYRKL